ncbi:MAG: hypothetical protein ABL921_11140 [Pirellula sp.]
MLGITVATIVLVIKNQPKKPPKNKPVAGVAGADSFGEPAEPVLDFGDELTHMENK